MKKETIPEKNRRIIDECWNGEHSDLEPDFCDTCEYDGEDEHYLRYCDKLMFPSFGMRITNCINYKEKD